MIGQTMTKIVMVAVLLSGAWRKRPAMGAVCMGRPWRPIGHVG